MDILPASYSQLAPETHLLSQSWVDLALILPVLVSVLCVIIELAHILATRLVNVNSARFGVRYAEMKSDRRFHPPARSAQHQTAFPLAMAPANTDTPAMMNKSADRSCWDY